ncbi:hypothetical protein [Sphingomonas sp. TREG-RG-20F-R18-01]|uniref:DUF6916 family protein n=1 Tax=Sphingomonas sp. TREG-RG-20F-R18-01 TaxID=2914982 RepID=UPI001F588AAF|nr:hypothetical protein [Sphingomonas sp. TREG-RG-20F-R18-01]
MAVPLRTCSDFAGHVGTTFTVGMPKLGMVALTLVEASRRRAVDGRASPFSLVFPSSSSETWPQSTYHMTHPVMGQLDIFLAPLRRVENGMDYVATFD